MVKDAYMTLKIRVCGEEEVRLHNPVKKFFLMGMARGNPNSMSDSVRYYSIPQSTFEAYFYIYPSGDPCIINGFEILSSLNPVTSWVSSDTSVLLTGGFGSHILKIDMSQPTDTKTVYLRAKSRGI
jgi:hypothetical protein